MLGKLLWSSVIATVRTAPLAEKVPPLAGNALQESLHRMMVTPVFVPATAKMSPLAASEKSVALAVSPGNVTSRATQEMGLHWVPVQSRMLQSWATSCRLPQLSYQYTWPESHCW